MGDAKQRRLEAARAAIEVEAKALSAAARRLGDELLRAADLILQHDGKAIVCGVGKSGAVARKLAATLCSAGSPAVYLHPTDALHGDLGIYSPGDPTILISKSGSTAELLRLVPILRDFDSPLIAILGAVRSPLAEAADVVLDASVEREADPENLVPTASAVVALALGDALCVALMAARGFRAEDFERCHPGGHLGATLRLRVRDAMHGGEEVAWAAREDSLESVLARMSARPLGAACIVDSAGRLEGIVTDGDIRRAIEGRGDIRDRPAQEIMTADPVIVSPRASLRRALTLMEARRRQISVLAVVDDDDGRCLGLLRLHDVYQAERA